MDPRSMSSGGFLFQAFFDPSSHHRLVLSFAFGLRHDFQGLNQVRGQPNCSGRMPLRLRHQWVELFGFHSVILRLDLFLLDFRQFTESFPHLFPFLFGFSSQPVKMRARWSPLSWKMSRKRLPAIHAMSCAPRGDLVRPVRRCGQTWALSSPHPCPSVHPLRSSSSSLSRSATFCLLPAQGSQRTVSSINSTAFRRISVKGHVFAFRSNLTGRSDSFPCCSLGPAEKRDGFGLVTVAKVVGGPAVTVLTFGNATEKCELGMIHELSRCDSGKARDHMLIAETLHEKLALISKEKDTVALSHQKCSGHRVFISVRPIRAGEPNSPPCTP